MSDLQTLLDRVKKATGPDQRIEVDLVHAFFDSKEATLHELHNLRMHEYTTSIDAALALVERILPAEWPDVLREAISELSRRHSWHITFPVAGQREELPLAILAALLSAIISKESQS